METPRTCKKPINISARLCQQHCHTEKAEARCMWYWRGKRKKGKGPESNRTTQSFSLMTRQYKIPSDRMTRKSAILGASFKDLRRRTQCKDTIQRPQTVCDAPTNDLSWQIGCMLSFNDQSAFVTKLSADATTTDANQWRDSAGGTIGDICWQHRSTRSLLRHWCNDFI